MITKTKQKNVTAVLEWRRRAKKMLIEAFGGKCGLCGYDRCVRNLAFHHLDPAVKDTGFGDVQSRAWAKIVAEVRKCVLLCHNCHGEVHDGLISDLSVCRRFDENYAHYVRRKDTLTKQLAPVYGVRRIVPCERCGVDGVKIPAKFCSTVCANLAREEKKRQPKEVVRDALSLMSASQAAVKFGVSAVTLRKWTTLYGISLKRGPKAMGDGGPGEIRTHAELSLV